MCDYDYAVLVVVSGRVPNCLVVVDVVLDKVAVGLHVARGAQVGTPHFPVDWQGLVRSQSVLTPSLYIGNIKTE